jgi:hypothetical protein
MVNVLQEEVDIEIIVNVLQEEVDMVEIEVCN